jgi:hypothetical protein
MTPETNRIDVGGYRLRAEAYGAGAPVFVCLHGLADTLAIWRTVAPALARRGRVVLVDQRGHGESDAPPGPYRREDLATDVCGRLIRERGHWIHVEAPDALVAALDRYVRPYLCRTNALPPFEEAVDKREPHPSRRPQKKGPPQGERKLSFENQNRTVRPEEPPSSGGVSKGVLARKSTAS